MGAIPTPMIVGCGRSGTTLVRSLLNAHSGLAMANEARFPVTMSRTPRRYGTGEGGFRLQRYIDDLYSLPPRRSRFRDWQITRPDVEDWLRDRRPSDLRSAIHATYALAAAQQDKGSYGDKAPWYSFELERLGALFPDAVFIHVVRDGRDVACAMRQARFGPDTVVGAALQWRLHVLAARRGKALFPAGRYVEVSYEALTASPEQTLSEMFGLLGLEPEPGALDRFQQGAAADPVSSQPQHTRLALGIRPGLRDWRKEMSWQERCVFEHLAGDVLTACGYELSTTAAERQQCSRWSLGPARSRFAMKRRLAHERLRVQDGLLELGVDRIPRVLA